AARAAPDIDFETPCPLLVIAPTVADRPDLDAEAHVQALRQTLPKPYQDADSPGRPSTLFRVVKTRDEVRDAFVGMHPRVVYYFGHAELRGGQLCLLCGDEDSGSQPVSANEFKQLMGGHYPLAAYINACKSGASGWHSVGYQLSPDVAVIIANATTAWTRHASLSGMAWLSRIIEHGQDPVIAAHAVDEHSSTRGFEWGMRTIHANYGLWSARPLASQGPVKPIGLRLDRDRSRERIASRVVSLARSDQQRVLSAVVYASPGNCLALSWRQLRDQLEDHASHVAQISWRTAEFPVERFELYTELRHELSISLGTDSAEPLEFALRRCARGLGLDGSTPILWLGWGVHTRADLSLDDLSAWVYFGGELAQLCPPDIRLVNYLAIESEDAPDPDLDDLFDDLSFDFVSDPAFEVELIPPLPDLSRRDIATFLNDGNNTNCPTGLVKDMAQALHTSADGKYRRTIELLERAEREGWYPMLRELRSDRRGS
ncbi:MAG: hypothetical protein AAGC55_05530, partial [Myxococcota bacterium]